MVDKFGKTIDKINLDIDYCEEITDAQYTTEEILKECWHKETKENRPYHDSTTQFKCKCGMWSEPTSIAPWKDGIFFVPQRTFDNYTDCGALEEALVRDGFQLDFSLYVWKKEGHMELEEYILKSPEQRCQLIVDFYKDKL
ncbi:hypothetical protein KAR91_09230 [Candidatus Pacearchaeota archaeon]|nr:hypothetical protein [Candidatus Pacearchaeota archaeon]